MEGMLAPRETAVCAAYMFLASAMWVVNKKTVKHLPVPFFVMLTQALATCVILKTLQRLRVVRMRPWRWEIFGEWLKTGFVWAVPLALNLRALTRLNPETLIVFRTATLIGVTFGDHAYGKRFQRRGCVHRRHPRRVAFYAWYDAQYDAEGYAWATLYWFAMVVSMLYVKHSFSVHKDLSIWDKTSVPQRGGGGAAGALLAALRVHVVRVRGALARGRDVVARELSHGGGAGVRVEQEPGFFISHRVRRHVHGEQISHHPRVIPRLRVGVHAAVPRRAARRARGGVAVFPGGNVVSAMRGVSRRGRGRGRAGGGFRRRGERQPGSTEGGHVGERRGGWRRRTKGETVNGEG